MAFGQTWDASFESLPTDANYMYEVDNYIRGLKEAIRERMEIDHVWKVGATDGMHKSISMNQVAAPTLAANTMYLYCKDVSAKIQLFIMDEDGNEIQVTGEGTIKGIPPGTKMLFYANTAPTGWTIDTTAALNDKAVMVTIGSGAGGAAGGAALAGGTWALTGLNTGPVTLTAAQSGVPAHTHNLTSYQYGGGTPAYPSLTGVTTGEVATATSSNSTANASASHAHTIAAADTWRPAAQCFIICTKN
jgi:hypothetical protein